VHGMALNITVQSYNGSLDFGLIACGAAMPDVAELARHLHAAYEELKSLPATAVEAPAEVAPQAVTRKATAKTKPKTGPAHVARVTKRPRASAPSVPVPSR